MINVSSQERERSCVLGHRVCLFLRLVHLILELFRQCGIFYFHVIIVTQRLPKTLQLKKKKKKAVKFRFFRTTDGGIFAKTPFLQMLWFLWVCNKRSDWCLESTRPWNQGTYIEKKYQVMCDLCVNKLTFHNGTCIF